MSSTSARPVRPTPGPDVPARPPRATSQAPGSRPAPTLAGELRESALLFAFALSVTAGAAAVARVLPGLAP